MVFFRLFIIRNSHQYRDQFMTNDKLMTSVYGLNGYIKGNNEHGMSFRLPPSPQGKTALKYNLRLFFLSKIVKMTNL
jgi:hypothetical protein